MLLNGYAGYSTLDALPTGLRRSPHFGVEMNWSCELGQRNRTRCLVVKAPGASTGFEFPTGNSALNLWETWDESCATTQSRSFLAETPNEPT